MNLCLGCSWYSSWKLNVVLDTIAGSRTIFLNPDASAHPFTPTCLLLPGEAHVFFRLVRSIIFVIVVSRTSIASRLPHCFPLRL